MNQIILMGRLTKDPEVRYYQTSERENRARASFSLAVDRKFKNNSSGGPTADFFNCVCFGSKAEFCEKYLKKGIKILITGRAYNNNYTTNEGTVVRDYQVILEEIYFAESKAAQAGAIESVKAKTTGEEQSDGFMNIPDGIDEELPFN